MAVRTNHFRSGLGVENEMSVRGAVIIRSTTAGGRTYPSFFRTSSGFQESWAIASAGSEAMETVVRISRRRVERKAPVVIQPPRAGKKSGLGRGKLQLLNTARHAAALASRVPECWLDRIGSPRSRSVNPTRTTARL